MKDSNPQIQASQGTQAGFLKEKRERKKCTPRHRIIKPQNTKAGEDQKNQANKVERLLAKE